MNINPGKSGMTYNVVVAEAVSTLRKAQRLDADCSTLPDFLLNEVNDWKSEEVEGGRTVEVLKDFQKAVELVREKKNRKGAW